jgi:hypothetical protein
MGSARKIVHYFSPNKTLLSHLKFFSILKKQMESANYGDSDMGKPFCKAKFLQIGKLDQ